MSDAVNEFNAGIIAEFRANEGKVGGMFQGANMLLLHTSGARSGAARVNPLGYRRLDDGWAVFDIPQFAEYESKAGREIPVVILTPR
jgi:hypothetical protein